MKSMPYRRSCCFPLPQIDTTLERYISLIYRRFHQIPSVSFTQTQVVINVAYKFIIVV